MATSFQPAQWSWELFIDHPDALQLLEGLNSQHTRIQAVQQAVPKTNADTWNFQMLDAIVNPVLSVGDHDPQFQIAVAPQYMYTGATLTDKTYAEFAEYSADLVRYYNGDGIDIGTGTPLKSPANGHITYWGIYNEFNIHDMTASDYVAMYNRVVPEMQAVDPTIKFVALELSDWGAPGQPWAPELTHIPTFVAGVTEQVDVVATHFYATCNQRETDAQLLSTVPNFGGNIEQIYQLLSVNPLLANVPVWITEHNVNADFTNDGTHSTCNPGQTFSEDPRGSSAFFAAWRPYSFSRFGKAGARALYHWDFAAGPQYGEINDQTGATRLSYWVDKWLQHYFPAPPGQDILELSAESNPGEIETLAVRHADDRVTIMLSNHAVAHSTDNNGTGVPYTITVNVGSLGTFSSARLLTIDRNTSAATGPVEETIAYADEIPVDINGYGVAFLTLEPENR